MSNLGKRKRGGSHAPVSALAARKAAKAAVAVSRLQEQASSNSETDEQLQLISDASPIEKTPNRYFVHPSVQPVEPEFAAEESIAPRDASPPVQNGGETLHAPRSRIDNECFSTWRPRADNHAVEEDSLRLRLRPGETLVLRGVARLTAESGCVQVGGAQVKAAGRLRLFAPTTAPLPVLVCNEEASIRLDADRTGIEGISRLAQEAGLIARGEDMWAGSLASVAPRDAGFDILLEPRPRLIKARCPQSWQSAIEYAAGQLQAAERPVVLVTGLPRIGKTMLARYLLNLLLSQHARARWLECDLGQSEFGPPGFVALHTFSEPLIGPSFCHAVPRKSTRAHFVGATEARSHPQFYLDAVADLVAQHDKLEQAPLVVNLPGWSKGLIADLQVSLERSIRASVQIHVGTADDSVKNDATPSERIFAEPINSEVADTLRIASAAKRQLSLLSWLHSSRDGPQWDFDVPLLARRPHLLPFDQIRVVQALLSEAPPESELLRLLNGSLVALVTGAEDSSDDTSMRYVSDPTFVPGSNTLGLALIRGVDSEVSCLHVLTPIPASSAEQASVLVRGAIEAPSVALIDVDDINETGIAGVPWKDVPFLEPPRDLSSMSTGFTGSGPKRVRRNLMRKSLISRT